MIEAIKTICMLAVALPIYGLFIFIGVKITRIEYAAYGTSVKAAFLAFILIIFLISGTTYIHPVAAYIPATVILPFGIKRVFQTTYVLACLASVIVLCFKIEGFAGVRSTHSQAQGSLDRIGLLPQCGVAFDMIAERAADILQNAKQIQLRIILRTGLLCSLDRGAFNG